MSNVVQGASPSSTAKHPWRAHWSQPSLAGKKIVIGYKVDKWARQIVARVIHQEQGVLVEDVTPDVAVVIVMRVASGAGPAKPSAAEKAAEKLIQAGATIEVLEYAEFFGRLTASSSEALEMFRAGPAALDRWEQLNLIGANTAWATISDADLRGCRLAGYLFDRTQLNRVDLRGADLTETTFCNIKDSQFDGANLTDAQLVGLENGSLVGVHGPGLRVATGHRATPGSGCDFSRAQIPSSGFHGFNAAGSRFVEVEASHAYFNECKLDAVDFSRAVLTEACFLRGSADQAVFAGVDLRLAHFRNVSLKNADFRGADLRGATFFDCDLAGALLDDAEVDDVNFIESKITSTSLSRAKGVPRAKRQLIPAQTIAAMQPALLQHQRASVTFTAEAPYGRRSIELMKDGHAGPHSKFALFIRTPERRRDHVKPEVLSRTRREFDAHPPLLLHYLGQQAKLLPETLDVWPKDPALLSLISDGLCEAFGQPPFTAEERAAVAAAEKKELAALKKTVLAELRSGEAGVQAFNARPVADLHRASLFAKADLSKVQLDGLVVAAAFDFECAKFDGSSLVNVRFSHVQLTKAKFHGAVISQSALHCQLTGAEFNGATLEQVDFRKAVLEKTVFTGAKLVGCRFSFANLCGADLSQATCVDCCWIGAQYNERTRLPPGLTEVVDMHWTGQGSPPHVLAAEQREAEAALATASVATGGDAGAQRAMRREIFMSKVKQNVDKAKIDRALKMLKADKFELFVETKDDHLVGVVKSQRDLDLVYACRLASDGSYQCCTQNLNVCGGLKGSPCKHLLVLTIGLERNDAAPPETLGLWIASSRNRQTTLDKEKMGEVLLRYKGAQAGELDWRPTETTPEDFYAF